jgi:fluoride exporter
VVKILYIAFGGAIGAVGRHLIASFFNSSKTGFPTGTFLVNLLGSLLIGLLMGFFAKANISDNIKLFLIIGILGGFTTFSSFAYESIDLLRNGEIKIALLYILGTNVFGILLAVGGFYLISKY